MSMKKIALTLSLCLLGQTAHATEQLHTEQLEDNFMKYISSIVQSQTNGAMPLQNLMPTGIFIDKVEPVSLEGGLTLYGVKAYIEQADGSSSEILFVTDETGTYRFGQVQEISSGEEAVLSQVPSLTAVDFPEGLAQTVTKGTGTHEVIFISDVFCPYCRRAFAYLLEHTNAISELKASHLPLPMHAGADAAAWVMAYAEQNYPAPLDVMRFAYTELKPASKSPTSLSEREAMQKEIVTQFVNKFPALLNGMDHESFFHYLHDTWGPKIDHDVEELAKLSITATPIIIVDSQIVSGFNQPQLERRLDN